MRYTNENCVISECDLKTNCYYVAHYVQLTWGDFMVRKVVVKGKR